MQCWSALLRGVPLAALPKPLLDRTVYDAACGITGQVCAARQAAQAAALREGRQPRCCGGSSTGTVVGVCAVGPMSALSEPPAESDEMEPPAPTESPASPDRSAAQMKQTTTGAATVTLPEFSPLKGITVWPSVGGWARLLFRLATDSSMGVVRGRASVIRLVLHFPAAELARLKAAALVGLEGDHAARLSTNDVLCAAMWRAVAQSRRKRGPLDYASSGNASLCFVANTRELVLPPEQQLYAGNAVVIAQVELPVATLHSGSLADAAAALRAAKARVTPQALRAEMAFVQAHADSRVTLGNAARNLRWNAGYVEDGCAVWDWTKFSLYNLDFGGGCKPFWMEPGLGGLLFPYLMGAASAPDGDGVVVYANVPCDEAATLLAALRKH